MSNTLQHPVSTSRPDTSLPLNRRTVLKAGVGAVVAAGSFTWFSRNIGAASGPLAFWNFYAPGGQVKSQDKWFQDMADAWNKSHDVKVQLQYTPVQNYMNGPKVQTAFASGEGPDIFLLSPGDFLRYYNGGVLADLTPYVDKDAQADFYPDVMGTRIVDGKIYGLPMEVEPMAMYYSQKAWDDAKLTEADIPQTWDQLLGIAKKLTSGNQFGLLFETAPGYYQNFTWYPFMWMGGADMVKDGKSSFNSPGTVQALKLWQDAVKQGVAPRKVLGTGGNDIQANLGSGYCAIQNVGIWGISTLRENAPDFKYGIFKLPLPPNGKYTTTLGGWAFVANAKGKNPEAAGQFIAWALGSMQPDSIQRMFDWCMKAKSDLAPRKSVMDEATKQGIFNSGPMKTFKDEVFPGGRGEPRVPPEVYNAVSQAIQACQLNGADPSKEAANASDTIDKFLATYKGASIL